MWWAVGGLHVRGRRLAGCKPRGWARPAHLACMAATCATASDTRAALAADSSSVLPLGPLTSDSWRVAHGWSGAHGARLLRLRVLGEAGGETRVRGCGPLLA